MVNALFLNVFRTSGEMWISCLCSEWTLFPNYAFCQMDLQSIRWIQNNRTDIFPDWCAYFQHFLNPYQSMPFPEALAELRHTDNVFQLVYICSAGLNGLCQAIEAFLSGRSSSRSNTATPVGTGPSAAAAALDDQEPRHRQNLGRAALRVS